jgi:O-antigen/teichoic acid export membrane protein
MGVIQRQGFKHSIVNFVGLAIGGASTLWLYPLVIGEYGIFQLILSAGVVGMPILALGANTVAIRFFPHFQDKASGHHGFLPFLFGLFLTGSLLAGSILLLSWDWLIAWMPSQKASTLSDHLFQVIPIACLWVLSSLLSIYSFNFKRIVIPSILLDFSQKITVPILLWMVYSCWLTLDQAIWGLLAHGILVFLGLLYYIHSIGQLHLKPDWRFFTPSLKRELGRFILFSSLGTFSILIISKADLFLVGSLMPIDNTGIYSIAVFLAAVIEVPTKSLYSASVSSVALHIANNDLEALESLYKKVSINLLCIGLLLFGALWIAIDDLYSIMQKTEIVANGKWVFFFIGLGKLADMASGLNNYMIVYSPHYMRALVPMGILAAANIAFGLYLIPAYGLMGAALSTFISILLYNTLSILIVWRKFKIFPFDPHTLLALTLAFVVYLLVLIIPRIHGFPILNAALHVGPYLLGLGGLFLGLRVSNDLNDLARQLFGKWRSFLR